MHIIYMLYWSPLKDSQSRKSDNSISFYTFSDYFKAINSPSDPFFQPDEDILHFNERFLNSEMKIMFEEIHLFISIDELKRAISELSLGLSGGQDCVLNEFLINGEDRFTPYLLQLFNKI